MKKRLNVGIVGLGYIGKVHAIAYNDISLVFSNPVVTANLKAVLRTSLGKDPEFLKTAGVGMETTSIEEFFDQPLDLVDVCSPTGMHTEYVMEAIKRRIPVYCEKPLGKDLEDARVMAAAAQEAGVLTHMAFVLRYRPAIRQMKAILDSGYLGEVLNFRGNIFHSSYLDPNRPMSWRLRNEESGGGAFADLGAHVIDMVRYLIGDVNAVSARMRTFIGERQSAPGSKQMENVDVDDWMHCVMELKNGAVGHIEATRMAAGVGDDINLQIFCRNGSVHFSGSAPDQARWYDLRKNQWMQGNIPFATPEDDRPIEAISPGSKFSQGAFTNAHLASCYDFMQCVHENKPSNQDFQAGLAIQEILEASYRSARHNGERIELPLE